MEIKGKKLLFLGGAIQVFKAVDQARKMGVYAIVTDRNENAPAKMIADEALPYSVTDVEKIISWCRQHPVDGVLNFGVDPAQKPCVIICEALGLPHFGTLEQVEYLSNKQAFKDLCRECGVDVIQSYQEEDINETFTNYPVNIKPAQNCGARGGSTCYTLQEALIGIEKAKASSLNGKIIIEKYMAGHQDLTVEYCFINGNAYLVKAGDRYVGRMEDGLNRQCIASVAPTKYIDVYLSKVHPRVVQMLRWIGIKDGALFMQGFWDGDTVRFYDPAYRFPASAYENNLLSATGVNLMEYSICYALGVPFEPVPAIVNCYTLSGKCAISLMIDSRPGTIAQFEGLDEIRQIPGVVTVAQKEHVGSEIPASGDVRQRVAEIALLVEDSRETIVSTVKTVQGKLKVLDSQGENMLVSPADPALFR